MVQLTLSKNSRMTAGKAWRTIVMDLLTKKTEGGTRLKNIELKTRTL